MIANLELSGLVLLDPWFLLVLPLAVLAFVWRTLRPRAALPTPSLGLYAAAGRTLRQRCAFVPRTLALLAGCCLAVAMARPVERKVSPIREQGIDIVLAIDTSSSMELPDMDQAMQLPRMDAARERAILALRAPDVPERLSAQVVAFVQKLRAGDYFKLPGVAETIDWANALKALDASELEPTAVDETLGVLLKYQDDIAKLRGAEAARLVDEARSAA